jgi:hypothetical protein
MILKTVQEHGPTAQESGESSGELRAEQLQVIRPQLVNGQHDNKGGLLIRARLSVRYNRTAREGES